VILFDDVITTGSTILEANRAVAEAGGMVLGFLGFAETILKTASKN
jgi:predicted amidophosphoribosyltransferase